MQTLVTLSGERAPAWLFETFPGVGLLRSEYLFRHSERYPTAESAREVLGDYFAFLAEVTSGVPVWYRTLEVTTAEANVLRGVEHRYPTSGHDLMGLRGIRRSMQHPRSLDAEFDAIAVARQRIPTLGLVVPFVTTADEVGWFAERVLARIGDGVPIASMIETPAAVLACPEILQVPGVGHVVLGCNDLRSLLDARPRVVGESTRISPALATAIRMTRDHTRSAGATMTVAGYLTAEIIEVARGCGVDAVSLHYGDLPALVGPAYADLPDLDRVARVKRLTRARISETRGGWQG